MLAVIQLVAGGGSVELCQDQRGKVKITLKHNVPVDTFDDRRTIGLVDRTAIVTDDQADSVGATQFGDGLNHLVISLIVNLGFLLQDIRPILVRFDLEICLFPGK